MDALGGFCGDGNSDRDRNEGKDKVENRHGTEDTDVNGMRVEMETVTAPVPRDLAGPASPQSQRHATPRVKVACPASSPGGRGH